MTESASGHNDNYKLMYEEYERGPRKIAELCYAARVGDVTKAIQLVEISGVNINDTDEWDNSPLFLASLCGHYDMVEYLLSSGAAYDKNSFEGARCVLAALTPRIKSLLINSSLSKKFDDLEPFTSHIYGIYSSSKPLFYGDVILQIHSNHWKQEFALHWFIIQTRLGFLVNLATTNNSSLLIIQDAEGLESVSWKALINYAYLRVEDTQREEFELILRFAQLHHLDDLIRDVKVFGDIRERQVYGKLKGKITSEMIKNGILDFTHFFHSHIIVNKLSVPCSGTFEAQDEENNGFEDLEMFLSPDCRLKLIQCSSRPDMIVGVYDDGTDSICYYPVHQSMLARSPYLETMFGSELFTAKYESKPIKTNDLGTATIVDRYNLQSKHVPVVNFSFGAGNAKIAEIILEFLYTCSAEIALNVAADIIFIAEEIFLDKLKALASAAIVNQLNTMTFEEIQSCDLVFKYSIYDLIRVSWVTKCDKLEQAITQVIALKLDDFVMQKNELKKIIIESSKRIDNREETDTIEFVDDLRYYLTKAYLEDNPIKYETYSTFVDEMLMELDFKEARVDT